jgi:hypothetical protein
MKITRRKQDDNFDKWRDWHILTVGEAGFSMLNVYGDHMHGVDSDIIRSFADRINRQDESGSLYPRAPISAIPKRFFRDILKKNIPKYLNEFKHHIIEFIEAYRSEIHARKILIDFHVSPETVPESYLSATEEVLREHANENEFDEIVLFV